MRVNPFSILALLVLFGCPPSPQPPAPDSSDAGMHPVAGDAGPACVAACTKLSALACSEGDAIDCAVVLQHVQDSRLVRSPSGDALSCACLAKASSRADVQACGVACR